MKDNKPGIYIEPGRSPWPHELHVAEILACSGHQIEFLSEKSIHRADIIMDGIEYEIKSPEQSKAITIERAIKKALKQSNNLIFDFSRMKNIHSDKLVSFLATQMKTRKAIHRLIVITKSGNIIDVSSML